MRVASLLRVSLFTAALAGGGSASVLGQAASPYRITGTVISDINGAPVRHCRLTATAVMQGTAANRRSPASQESAVADERGHFSLSVPSAGAWRLVATAPGFVSQAYDEHQQFSSAIVLTPEAPTINLRFRLPPEAVVTGLVLDEAGEPVRNAHLSLLSVPPMGPDARPPVSMTRAATQTDDRGIYEFTDIVPGDYRITLQAQPWYAASIQPRRSGLGETAQSDPSLDVVYPLTWFPGVDDPALVETLTLHGGDTRQADFHLVPIPAVHLRIVPPPSPTMATGRANPSFPVVERVTQGGGTSSFLPVSVNYNPQGQMDIGGLSPGLYQIRLQGQSGSESRTTFVEVAAGSVRTVDFGAPPTSANITTRFDGIPDSEANSIRVRLLDADTGQPVLPTNMGQNGNPENLRRRQPGGVSPDRVLQVPPGRYEVTLIGKPDIFLTGITAQSAEVTGRIIKVSPGDLTITLHVATGRATLSGKAMLAGKPAVGAMVLLVPASLGDSTGITILRRDQTNTDGSFDLAGVIPGQYILIAIENGWNINWSDPSTLRNYLMHGLPLDLSSSANVKQNIEPQSP